MAARRSGWVGAFISGGIGGNSGYCGNYLKGCLALASALKISLVRQAPAVAPQPTSLIRHRLAPNQVDDRATIISRERGR